MIFSMKIDNGLEKYKDGAISKVKKAVKKHAFIIQAKAASKAPVDTGALKNSIHALPEGDGSNWTVQDGVEYGIYQELGHGIGVSYDGGGNVTFAKGFASAKHFLGNACEADADKFFDDVREALE